MHRATPWAALALLVTVMVALIPAPTAAVRMDMEGDLDVDYDHPHEHHKDEGGDGEDGQEGPQDDDVELDLGVGRPFRRVRMPRIKDPDWSLDKLLNSEDALRWEEEINGGKFEDILSKYTSDIPEDLDEWE